MNPLVHIDVVGSLLMPLAFGLLIGIPAGYAKPVPIDYLRLGRVHGAYVAGAGPLANVIQAGIWATASVMYPSNMATTGVLLNCALCVLNMLPIKPLDGWWVCRGLR